VGGLSYSPGPRIRPRCRNFPCRRSSVGTRRCFFIDAFHAQGCAAPSQSSILHPFKVFAHWHCVFSGPLLIGTTATLQSQHQNLLASELIPILSWDQAFFPGPTARGFLLAHPAAIACSIPSIQPHPTGVIWEPATTCSHSKTLF
jgi:hypothetical protein